MGSSSLLLRIPSSREEWRESNLTIGMSQRSNVGEVSCD